MSIQVADQSQRLYDTTYFIIPVVSPVIHRNLLKEILMEEGKKGKEDLR